MFCQGPYFRLDWLKNTHCIKSCNSPGMRKSRAGITFCRTGGSPHLLPSQSQAGSLAAWRGQHGRLILSSWEENEFWVSQTLVRCPNCKVILHRAASRAAGNSISVRTILPVYKAQQWRWGRNILHRMPAGLGHPLHPEVASVPRTGQLWAPYSCSKGQP